MSYQAIDWVLKHSEATSYPRLILIAIASHANKHGENAYPSLDLLAREALICRREAVYCVQFLEELGEISVVRGIGRGKPNVYSLPLMKKCTPMHELEKEKGASEFEKGASGGIKGARFSEWLSRRQNKANGLLEEKMHLEGERLREPSKARTVKPSDICSFPEPSKSKTVHQQLDELKARGWL